MERYRPLRKPWTTKASSASMSWLEIGERLGKHSAECWKSAPPLHRCDEGGGVVCASADLG